MKNKIILNETNPDQIKTVLQQGLREYNLNFFGNYELKRFAAYIQDDESKIIAGIHGFTVEKHKTIRLEFVWVEKKYRKQSLGTKLLDYIQKYAIEKNCIFIQVSSMEFQGIEFYKKMGFKQ
jgi:ribosomal protein S18 acetylase RimI-like enzyme